MANAATGHPRPGDLIAGKFQVEQVLGAGGMGVVVAAWHAPLRQRVAVKLLLPDAMRLPDAIARFLQEAQAAVAIRSEHVARVIDVGTLDTGVPFLVMEHLAGTDLRRLLRQRGPLPVDEAVDFVLQAIEALAEAHALGIVHRDLKPANLFLTHRADGSPLVKVLDFGLSKVVSTEHASDRSLTTTDVVAGSPEYMSPEQVRSLRNVDRRTDIWSMGIVLYELLSRKRPFTGPTSAAVCASIAADPPKPLRAHRPDVAEALQAVIMACLEKDPGRRTGSMGELAAGLAPFAPARSLPSIERAARLSPGGMAPAGAATTAAGPDSAGSGGGARAGAGGARAGAPAVTMGDDVSRTLVDPATDVHHAPSVTVAGALAGATTTIADERPPVSSPPASTAAGGWGRTGQPVEARRGVHPGAVIAIAGIAVLSTGLLVWQLAWGGAGAEAQGAPAVSSSEEPAAGLAPVEPGAASGSGQPTGSTGGSTGSTGGSTAQPAASAPEEAASAGASAGLAPTSAPPAAAVTGGAATARTTRPVKVPPRAPAVKPPKKPDLSLDRPL